MLKRFQKWTIITSTESPLRLSILVFTLAFGIVITWSFLAGDYRTPDYWQNVRVEAHGMLFDLGILGVFVFWLNSLGEIQRKKQRYQEEIDDYLGWESDEAKYRIIGNIKRLNRKGVSKINLVRANLKNAELWGVNLNNSTLTGANLQQAILPGANLQKVNFIGANLHKAQLVNANLSGANLISATLTQANFRTTNLQKTSFVASNLQGAIFCQANLSGATLTGAILVDAELEGAVYNEHTVWPEGFDPNDAGAILVDN